MKDKYGRTVKVMILYRGLGLDYTAINSYIQMIDTNSFFTFRGFTSTSANKEKAIGFALKAESPKIPCLFQMTVRDKKYNRVYLNTKEYTAYEDEKEVLLGMVYWKVEDVCKEEDDDFMLIKLKEAHL